MATSTGAAATPAPPTAPAGAVVKVTGGDATCLTFTIQGEDHTLGNALRYILMRNADVEFCGYNIPHPSDDFVNIRVQTLNGVQAVDAMRQALQELAEMTDVFRERFTEAAEEAGADLG